MSKPESINGIKIVDAIAYADKWLEENDVSELWDMIRTLRDATEWEERKRGEWLPCTKEGITLSEQMRKDGARWYGYKCSNCNFIYKGNALRECDYCQRCGVDMRGGEDERIEII